MAQCPQTVGNARFFGGTSSGTAVEQVEQEEDQMRDILFRSKSVHTNEWCYGHYINFRGAGCAEHETRHYICEYPDHLREIYTDTLGQYTGVDDANGARIFEGDIVQVHVTHMDGSAEDAVGRVEYINGTFSVKWAGSDYGRNFLAYLRNVGVIGNVHDNPELLEIPAKAASHDGKDCKISS